MSTTPSSERDEKTSIKSDLAESFWQYITALRDPSHTRAACEIAADHFERRFEAQSRHQTQIAQVRYALDGLRKLEADLPTKFSPDDGNGFSGGWHLDTYKLAVADFRYDLKAAIQAQQTRLDELSKGIGGDDGLV